MEIDPSAIIAARGLIDRFQEEAISVAELQVRRLTWEGDSHGAAIWKRIMKAIEQVQATKPDDGAANVT